MDKERYIFEKFRSKLNGDDCAVIGERAYCKDLFVEDVHFRRGWLSLREIGAKAMLVNISDMIATNARAKYALLGLALPREIGTREIDELCAGVSETAREWGIRVIGGDTIGSDRIALSVSLIGKCKRPVFRSGARVGDLIAHTGELGSVRRDLAVLLRDEILPASSQMQNRNDKISSLQGPSDEVQSSGDKISSAHAKLQSLDAETSTQNFAAKLPAQGSLQRSCASEILKCENAAAEVLALKDDMSENLASANFIPEKEPSVKFAPRNPALANFVPQTDALANFVLQNDGSAANSMFKNTASASPASQNLVPRNDLSASAAVENFAPKSPVAPAFQNFTCETSALQSAAQEGDMSASPELQNSALRNSEPQNFMSQNSTAQSLACENSAPQSQAYEGSVFDLREDLRAQISKNSRFVRPVLRDKFFYKAAKFISAAMDISDGLAQDLPRLLEASGVGARWIARPSEAALQSGEEYEILFSFAPKFLPKIYAIAAKTGVAINIIAEVCPRTPQSSMEFHGSSHHFAP